MSKFLIFLIALIFGCAQKTEIPKELPAEFVSMLKRATTNEGIFKLINAIPLAPHDTIYVGNITYLDVTKDGRLVILDRANHTPLVFDSTGKFLNRIGKHGAGPGEFERASAVCYDDSNQIWYVADNSLLRISIFKNTGEYLRDFKIAAKIHEMRISKAGELYLFMPNRRDGEMIECVSSTGKRIASFFSPDIIQKIPFGIFGGGFCFTRPGVVTAHFVSSEVKYFDYRGKLKFKVDLISLKNYSPPPDTRNIQSPADFMNSFTGIAEILRGPFEVILVQYHRRAATNKSGQGATGKPTTYLAFLTRDGKVLASGIEISTGYFASDDRGDLYSVEYPEAPTNQHGNPVINKWTLKSF
ncbi:MAG: 6-bladed beta-propeller [candidate division KSB1 bacterium]|nr:6-bladed beta-propeller [candidate division KSB1 bacterium]